MAGPRKEILTTPKGIAEPYCSLQKPDYGNPEKGFGNPRGLWKVDLTVSSRAAQPLIDTIVQAHEANYKKLLAEHEKNPPVVPRGKKPLLPYEGDMPFVDNGDGTVTFKIKGY
ncbi:single-stranded DNA-binding protein, partial [Pseudomonas antarctica]